MGKRGLLKFVLLSMMCMMVITGCSNKKIESALDTIRLASNKTAKLTGGEFEFTYQLEDGDKNAKKANQKVCGEFRVNEKKTVDWTRKIYIADETSPRAEQKQEKGIQYQKSKTDDWFPINENAVGYPPELEDLLNIAWKVEDVKKVSEEKQESGNVIYKIAFSDDFLGHLKQDRIDSIKKELKRAKKDKNSDQAYLDGLEDSIKTYQVTHYQKYNAEILIDKNGVFLEYKTTVTTEDGNETPALISTVRSTVGLKSYTEN